MFTTTNTFAEIKMNQNYKCYNNNDNLWQIVMVREKDPATESFEVLKFYALQNAFYSYFVHT